MKSATKRLTAVITSHTRGQDGCQDVWPSVVKTSSGSEPDQSDMLPAGEKEQSCVNNYIKTYLHL